MPPCHCILFRGLSCICSGACSASVPGPVLHLFRGLRTMQGPGDFQRTVFEVNEWVMPAGTSQEFTIIAIGAEASATVVRGHYERLGCCSKDLPPQPDPGLVSANQGSAGAKRSLFDVADGQIHTRSGVASRA